MRVCGARAGEAFPPSGPPCRGGRGLAAGSGVQWAVSGPTGHLEPRPWGTGSCSAGGPASAAAEDGAGARVLGQSRCARRGLARRFPGRGCVYPPRARAPPLPACRPSSSGRPARGRRGVARALGSGGRDHHPRDRRRRSGDTCGVNGRDSSVRHSREQRHWPWPGAPTPGVWRGRPRTRRGKGVWLLAHQRPPVAGGAVLSSVVIPSPASGAPLLLHVCRPRASGWGYGSLSSWR